MYFARLVTAAGLSSFLLLITNCSEDPIQADLSTNDLSLDTLLLKNISKTVDSVEQFDRFIREDPHRMWMTMLVKLIFFKDNSKKII